MLKAKNIIPIIACSLLFGFSYADEEYDERIYVYDIEDDYGQELLEKIEEEEYLSIWVYYDTEATPEYELRSETEIENQRQKIQANHESMSEFIDRNDLHVSAISEFRSLNSIAMTVDKEALKAILSFEQTKKIRESYTFTINTDDTTSPSLVNSKDLWNGYDLTGEGQAIVILDTGVDHEHEMLDGKVIDGACFSTNDLSNNISSLCDQGNYGIEAGSNCEGIDGCGHGTHVAGIAAGNSDSHSGVAKGADLISIQVFSEYEDDKDCDGDAPCLGAQDKDIANALEHVYDSLSVNYNLASVNMSLGYGNWGGSCDGEYDDPHDIENAINSLTEFAGVPVVAAAGEKDIGSGVDMPACFSNAISVGATDKSDEVWEDSPEGNAEAYKNDLDDLTLDLVAPGVNIESAIPGNNYKEETGTSMAAPHVAGTIALMRERSITSSVDAFRDFLSDHAYWDVDTMPDGGTTVPPPSDDYGYGRVDAFQTVLHYLEGEPNTYFVEQNELIEDHTFEGRDVYVRPFHDPEFKGTITFDTDDSFDDRTSNFYAFDTIVEGPADAELVFVDGGELHYYYTNFNFQGEITHLIHESLVIDDDRIFASHENVSIQSGGELIINKGNEVSFHQGATLEAELGAEILSVSASGGDTQTQGFIASGSDDKQQGQVETGEMVKDTPDDFSLHQNYPNPFNPATNIEFELPQNEHVTLEIFDITGRKVTTLVDETIEAGTHSIKFDASGLSSGVYIYRIRASDFVESRQLTFIK